MMKWRGPFHGLLADIANLLSIYVGTRKNGFPEMPSYDETIPVIQLLLSK